MRRWIFLNLVCFMICRSCFSVQVRLAKRVNFHLMCVNSGSSADGPRGAICSTYHPSPNGPPGCTQVSINAGVSALMYHTLHPIEQCPMLLVPFWRAWTERKIKWNYWYSMMLNCLQTMHDWEVLSHMSSGSSVTIPSVGRKEQFVPFLWTCYGL